MWLCSLSRSFPLYFPRTVQQLAEVGIDVKKGEIQSSDVSRLSVGSQVDHPPARVKGIFSSVCSSVLSCSPNGLISMSAIFLFI